MQRHKRWHTFTIALKGGYGIKHGHYTPKTATLVRTVAAAAASLGTGKQLRTHLITRPFQTGESVGQEITTTVRPVWTNPVTRGISHVFTDIKHLF